MTDSGIQEDDERTTLRSAMQRSAALEREVNKSPEKFRVLTGDRPTGSLHVGHYFGTLQNRVRLQNLGVETLILIADYQILTDRDASESLQSSVENILLDYLAVGLDPKVTSMFAQSAVKSLNQLMLPFLSLVSTQEIGRNPTVKEEIAAAGKSSVSGLMFTYPVHQAADILFCRSNLVPVGKDQLPHIELVRTIAKRFNSRYCKDGEELFPLPDALLGSAPLLLGTDGQKMSKSRANSITIGATAEETARLIKGAKTDTERSITYDPKNRPEVSNLVLLAALCQDKAPEVIAEQIGDSGSARLKQIVTESLNEYFRPIRARRTELSKDKGAVWKVLTTGNERAIDLGERTLSMVKSAMNMAYPTGK